MFRYADRDYLTANPSWHEEDGPYKASLVRRAVERNGLAFRTCADVGCGAGRVTEILASSYPHATFVGYDPSADAASFWAQRSAPNLSYRLGAPEPADKPFDLVLCLDVFEHVPDYMGFLRELARTGSRFVFNVPLDLSAVKLLVGGLKSAREEVGHLHHFSEFTAAATLRDSGFTVDDVFLSPAFRYGLPRSVKQALVLGPRLAASVLGRSLAARIAGGYSAVITASPAPARG